MKKLFIVVLFSFVFSTFFHFAGAEEYDVDLDFRNIPITDAFRLLSEQSSVPVVLSNSIQGNVSINLKGFDFYTAFDYLSKASGLTYTFQDGVYFVDSLDDSKVMIPEVVTYPARFMKVSNVLPSLITSSFHAYQDEFLYPSDELGYLVAHMPDDRFLELMQFSNLVDGLRSQVLIEAKIVEVKRDSVNALGVNWGASFLKMGNFSLTGSADLTPALASGFGFGFVSSRLFLDHQLELLETDGDLNIVSSPRLFVFDRKSANISTGSQVPYQEFQADGVVTTSFKDAFLSLTVVPVVNGDDILIDISLSKDEPNFSKGVSVQPSIDTTRLTSSVMVTTGQTVALGGVFSSSESNSRSRVPFFSRLPLIGKAFKSKNSASYDTELLLFLTATIVKRN